MLYRKRIKDISSWYHNSNKALLVTGARQVGKTFIIENVLAEETADVVKFNLIEQPEVIDVFNSVSHTSIDTFISRLTLLTDKALVKGRTVLFFDEIQKCKDIVTKIKFLVLDGSFKYIFSGSLLGVELTGLNSAPVGFLDTLDMYPLDFEEFCIALGLKQQTLDILHEHFDSLKPVDDFIHQRLLEAFYNYLVIGGMPEAVSDYINNNDYNNVFNIHRSIIRQYKNDFTQYEDENKKLKLVKTYDLIPAELSDKNKRYTFTHLKNNLKYNRIADSFEWLISAGVALPVYNITEPKLPLKASEKSNLFKLFLSDTGMLTSMFGKSVALKTLNGEKNINYGATFENIVAQELIAHGYEGYYYTNKKMGELDFVIEYQNSCTPIEVKSGKDYTVHSALNNVLSVKDYYIEKAFVLCADNISTFDKLVYLPIYMIMFFDESSIHFPKFDIPDLRNL